MRSSIGETAATLRRTLGHPTVVSLAVAMAVGTAVVVAGSDYGFRDIGKGIWWYEYYPFYSHGHGDGIYWPATLPIYLNLAAVVTAAYVPIRILERRVRSLDDGRETSIPPRRLLGTFVLAVILGLPLVGGASVLDLLTLLVSVTLDIVGFYGPLPEAELSMNSAVLTPAAAVGWLILYGLAGLGESVSATVRTRI